MHRPGESLRQEREARGKTIEEMAEATGIRPHLLAALEQEAFDALPGRGFSKLYIRAYAEVLGFDPLPVIEAYDDAVRARQAESLMPELASAPRPLKATLARWRKERIARRAEAILSGEYQEEPVEELAPLEDAAEPMPTRAEQEIAPAGELIEEVPVLPLPMEAVSPSRPARSHRWLVASLLLLVLVPVMGYVVSSMLTPDEPPVAARQEPAPREAIAPPPSRPQPPQAAEAPRPAPRALAPGREPTASSSLKVAESGVGLRLDEGRLEGQGDHFRSGQRVTFTTRVLGGQSGESIRHVWLRDGKVVQSIRLRVGGASWRTYSTKTLGRPGSWSVEARDEQGRVLARADLDVAP